jgi:hypothetical protein
MLTIALIVILAVLIILERCRKINLANMGAGVFMMISVSVLCGLYVMEFVKTLFALASNVLGFDSRDLEFLNPMFEGMSKTVIIIKLVLLITLMIPFAIGAIYIIQAMVRKPLLRQPAESDDIYSLRCSVRSLTLGIISALCVFICLVVMIVAIIPYFQLFIESFVLFNPIVIIVVCIFTCGLGLFILPGMFVVINSTLITLLFAFGLVAMAFYVFSVILGISACVRARRAGVITTVNALIYGVLSFMSGWNLIPYIILRQKLKKQI